VPKCKNLKFSRETRAQAENVISQLFSSNIAEQEGCYEFVICYVMSHNTCYIYIMAHNITSVLRCLDPLDSLDSETPRNQAESKESKRRNPKHKA